MPEAARTDRDVDVGGRRLRVHVVGSGPPVLLLHGSGPGATAQAAWQATWEALADRFELVAPDQAGFGASPLPARRGGRALWTEQATALMDLLGHGRYSIVGHSMGGAVALAVAAARPDAVAAVAGIGCMGAPMLLPDALDRLWASRPTRADAREVQRLIAADPNAPIAEDAVDGRLAAMLAQGGDAYAALFPPPRQRWVDDLALTEPVRAPVLLVHGARDRIVPLRDGALPLVEGPPRAHLYVLGDCGHSPHVERPDIVHRLLGDFLEINA